MIEFNVKSSFRSLNIGALNLFGIWNLLFGISPLMESILDD